MVSPNFYIDDCARNILQSLKINENTQYFLQSKSSSLTKGRTMVTLTGM